jgi:hypothetical protein
MKFVYLFLIAGLFVYGCSSDKGKDEQEIKDVIYKNIQAGNNEDVAAYMSTIDKENKNYGRMEEMMNKIYSTYDLSYQVKDLKIIELKDNEAKVQFVQITKKIKGPTFRDNRILGIYTFHKTNGEWKIYDTQITKMDYLN